MGFQERVVQAAGVVSAGEWRVKQYQVTVDEQPIDPAVVAAAERFLPALLPSPPAADETPRLAFSVLHHGMDAVWLNLYSWCREAILQCRASSAALAAPTAFAELSEPLIGCVWELPALVHERSVWVRHLLQGPRPDVDAYLSDWLPDGPVGRP